MNFLDTQEKVNKVFEIKLNINSEHTNSYNDKNGPEKPKALLIGCANICKLDILLPTCRQYYVVFNTKDLSGKNVHNI